LSENLSAGGSIPVGMVTSGGRFAAKKNRFMDAQGDVEWVLSQEWVIWGWGEILERFLGEGSTVKMKHPGTNVPRGVPGKVPKRP
jgi:hypothetical protein